MNIVKIVLLYMIAVAAGLAVCALIVLLRRTCKLSSRTLWMGAGAVSMILLAGDVVHAICNRQFPNPWMFFFSIPVMLLPGFGYTWLTCESDGSKESHGQPTMHYKGALLAGASFSIACLGYLSLTAFPSGDSYHFLSILHENWSGAGNLYKLPSPAFNLYHVLSAVAGGTSMENQFIAGRIISLVSVVLIATGVWLATRRMSGLLPSSIAATLVFALILADAARFTEDTLFRLLFGATVVAMVFAIKNPLWWLAAAVAAGLATLTKELGFILVVAAALAIAFDRQPLRARVPIVVGAMLLYSVMVFPLVFHMLVNVEGTRVYKLFHLMYYRVPELAWGKWAFMQDSVPDLPLGVGDILYRQWSFQLPAEMVFSFALSLSSGHDSTILNWLAILAFLIFLLPGFLALRRVESPSIHAVLVALIIFYCLTGWKGGDASFSTPMLGMIIFPFGLSAMQWTWKRRGLRHVALHVAWLILACFIVFGLVLSPFISKGPWLFSLSRAFGHWTSSLTDDERALIQFVRENESPDAAWFLPHSGRWINPRLVFNRMTTRDLRGPEAEDLMKLSRTIKHYLPLVKRELSDKKVIYFVIWDHASKEKLEALPSWLKIMLLRQDICVFAFYLSEMPNR